MYKIIFLIILLSIAKSNSQVKSELYLIPTKANNHYKIAALIELDKGWHIYWRNPGDIGIPTEFKWKLPDGVKVSNPIWPIPDIFESEGLFSYGYENKTIFLFDLILEDSIKLSEKITFEINSLICKEICIPFDTTITFNLDEIRLINNSDYFLTEHKIEFPSIESSLKISVDYGSEKVVLKLSNIDSRDEINGITFLPYENGIFKNVKNISFNFVENVYNVELNFDPFKTHNPKIIEGILLINFQSEDSFYEKVYEISCPIKGQGN